MANFGEPLSYEEMLRRFTTPMSMREQYPLMKSTGTGQSDRNRMSLPIAKPLRETRPDLVRTLGQRGAQGFRSYGLTGSENENIQRAGHLGMAGALGHGISDMAPQGSWLDKIPRLLGILGEETSRFYGQRGEGQEMTRIMGIKDENERNKAWAQYNAMRR